MRCFVRMKKGNEISGSKKVFGKTQKQVSYKQACFERETQLTNDLKYYIPVHE